jgi:integrase
LRGFYKKNGTDSEQTDKMFRHCLTTLISSENGKNIGVKNMLFLDYLPAELKIYKSGWYAIYYAKNPQTSKLQRKTVKLNRIDNLTERRKYARKLVTELNLKLHSGWNPFLEQEAPRGFTKLTDALDTYLRVKTKELRSTDSQRTYRSMVEILKNYINNIIKKPDMLTISFDALQARNYMDYVYNERGIGGQTFNNYKLKTSGIWNWFIENLYCKSNPFETVKKKREAKKTRQIIDFETRKRIKEHLTKNEEYEFLAMVMLCFHGLIRPKEICHLKSSYINMEKKIIFLPKEITKDDDDRIVTMTEELQYCLQKLNLENISKDLYVFSTNWKPGKQLQNTRYIGKRWDKLRKELKMPVEYQFYSLKDSGIVQKLQDGISPIDVRNQAGHSSLEQTNQYAKYANPEGSEQIKKKSSEF